MPYYSYIAKDRRSRTVRGREFAMSDRELAQRLMRKELTVISIKQAKERGLFGRGRQHVGTFDMLVLCKQLSSMVKGGIPLVRAIDAIAGETANQTLQSALAQVSHSIRSGDSFSSSLKRAQGIFSPLFVAIVEAGEKVGALDVMLERLNQYLAARDRINKKIIGAVTYPSVILVFFICALTGVALFLVPKFKGIYTSFGAKLPPLTKTIFDTSDFVLAHAPAFVIILTLTGFLAHHWFFKTRRGRLAFDRFALRMPILGGVVKKASISKFSRTLSTLMAQGIPVTESLELVARTAGNMVIENATLKACKLITDGAKIPEALTKAEIFPSLMIQMTSIGVESGNLPELLDKTADLYEDQVDAFIAVMSSMIEPILIVALGIILGITVIALYLPIFQLNQAVGAGGM
jgi:type IV pilus assembly protein PilC